MTPAVTPPAGTWPAPVETEMQIMQAIVKNCTALGIDQDTANRMAVRSILNRRRAARAT